MKEDFSALIAACVIGDIGFDSFVKRAARSFDSIAWFAVRGRRPPGWIDVKDVRSEAVALAWIHMLGPKRFEAEKRRTMTAARYVRLRIRRGLSKFLSRVRGENQHTRNGMIRAWEFVGEDRDVAEWDVAWLPSREGDSR